jgi:eukaryotic-like serine/threonine-protein kinase
MSEPCDEPSAEAPTVSKGANLHSGYSAFEGATEDFGIGPGETDPFIGADLGGVTVVRLIGQGGMGRVYEARQVKPSRTVAVKVIRPGVVSESHMRRFDLEAEILARLRHPGIAQIYTVGAYRLPTGEVPFFVMEYIPDAQTLVDYADQKQLSTHERPDLFQKVCDAVAHGHARGVVHRKGKRGRSSFLPQAQPSGVSMRCWSRAASSGG